RPSDRPERRCWPTCLTEIAGCLSLRTTSRCPDDDRMDIAILIFEGLTALDAIGPYAVLRNLPSPNVRIVAKRPGAYRDQAGLVGLEASHALTDMPSPDVLVVPGGFGVERVILDEETLGWVRAAHEHTTWTTSVCTGSIILGAAGLLDGAPATT